MRALTHVYPSVRQPLVALSGLDLEVGSGELLSIIGPSGGGKTTLLRAMAGLLEPTAGTVLIDGRAPREAQRRKAIGFVSQDPALLPWRTVTQNVALPFELNPGKGQVDSEEVERTLEAVGLAEFRDYYPLQLSAGMRQRVAFARALLMDPEVLLMDEPLGALDEITRASMRYELLRLWEESHKTIVLVTHSIPEAVMISDRVVVLSARPGRVLREVQIELPRPRDESFERSEPYLFHAEQIRQALSTEAVSDRPGVATSTPA